MKLRINIEGKTYDVEVEVLDEGPAGPLYGSTSVNSGALPGTSAPAAPPAAQPPAPAGAPAPPSGGGDRCVKAPIAGVIIKLQVAPGDTVTQNQVLLTMEAMKMETNVASPLDGKVRTVRVSPGESVKTGQVLIEFE